MHRRLLAIALLGVTIFAADATAQNKKPWAPPKAGVWNVSATDEENTEWKGKMTLVRQGSRDGRLLYRGHFDWESTNGETSGRENFRGSFDRRTGVFRFSSYSVKSEKGNLATGHYVSRIRNKGTELTSGSWKGKDVVPGNWSAEWSDRR